MATQRFAAQVLRVGVKDCMIVGAITSHCRSKPSGRNLLERANMPNTSARCWLGAAKLFTLGIASALVACAATNEPSPATAQVFKARGAVQCGGRGAGPEVMSADLEHAGITVRASACGSDGRMRPAVCGAGTGEINIFDIAASDQARAQTLGFAPLAQLRDAQRLPCR